jgi:hypothetical protein
MLKLLRDLWWRLTWRPLPPTPAYWDEPVEYPVEYETPIIVECCEGRSGNGTRKARS